MIYRKYEMISNSTLYYLIDDEIDIRVHMIRKTLKMNER